MADRDPLGDESDSARHLYRRSGDPRDPERVADDAASPSWRRGGESRYGAAAPRRGQPSARPDTTDAPLEMHIEFVQLDGPPGRALRRRQAQIMRKVLQWIAEHPNPGNQ
jgi:hypothetical protein